MELRAVRIVFASVNDLARVIVYFERRDMVVVDNHDILHERRDWMYVVRHTLDRGAPSKGVTSNISPVAPVNLIASQKVYSCERQLACTLSILERLCTGPSNNSASRKSNSDKYRGGRTYWSLTSMTYVPSIPLALNTSYSSRFPDI